MRPRIKLVKQEIHKAALYARQLPDRSCLNELVAVCQQFVDDNTEAKQETKPAVKPKTKPRAKAKAK